MDPLVRISEDYIIELAVVVVSAVLGIWHVYRGLTGATSLAGVEVPPWFLVAAGMVFQIPLLIYIYLGITADIFEKLYQYLS